MRDVVRHRGPDDEGIFIDRNVGLGHRRLSIVDVAAGHQPMTNEDGSLQIIYNGEVYNHADYRDDLEARGHVYRTHCDTETILHLYEEHGDACVNFLRGMFAFAIWNTKKKELFIARDRLGVKPLYYFHEGDVFGFRYDTLDWHIERGLEWFLLTRDEHGDIRFRIEARWQRGVLPNWWMRAGFAVLAGYYQRKWHRRAHWLLSRFAHDGSTSHQRTDVTFTYHTQRKWPT